MDVQPRWKDTTEFPCREAVNRRLNQFIRYLFFLLDNWYKTAPLDYWMKTVIGKMGVIMRLQSFSLKKCKKQTQPQQQHATLTPSGYHPPPSFPPEVWVFTKCLFIPVSAVNGHVRQSCQRVSVQKWKRGPRWEGHPSESSAPSDHLLLLPCSLERNGAGGVMWPGAGYAVRGRRWQCLTRWNESVKVELFQGLPLGPEASTPWGRFKQFQSQ